MAIIRGSVEVQETNRLPFDYTAPTLGNQHMIKIRVRFHLMGDVRLGFMIDVHDLAGHFREIQTH